MIIRSPAEYDEALILFENLTITPDQRDPEEYAKIKELANALDAWEQASGVSPESRP